MSTRAFFALLVVTLVSVGLAGWAIAGRDLPVGSTELDRPLAPELAADLDAVTRLVVQANGQRLTVQRDGQRFVLVERGGFPVETAKVRQLLLALADARLIEAKTAKDALLPRLDLGPPDAADATSKGLRVEAADGRVLADLVLGKTRFGLYGAGRSGAYVRRAGESQAFLVDRAIELPELPLDWLNRTVLDLPVEELASVTVAIGTERPVTLARATPEAPTLTPVPLPPNAVAQPEKIAQLAGSLAPLDMLDVQPAADIAFPPAAPRSRFVLTDGTTLEVIAARIGEGDDAAHWLRFAVTLPAPPTSPPPTDGGTPAPADPAAMARATMLQQRLDGFAFKVPEWLAVRFAWTEPDLVAPAAKGS